MLRELRVEANKQTQIFPYFLPDKKTFFAE